MIATNNSPIVIGHMDVSSFEVPATFPVIGDSMLGSISSSIMSSKIVSFSMNSSKVSFSIVSFSTSSIGASMIPSNNLIGYLMSSFSFENPL